MCYIKGCSKPEQEPFSPMCSQEHLDQWREENPYQDRRINGVGAKTKTIEECQAGLLKWKKIIAERRKHVLTITSNGFNHE